MSSVIGLSISSPDSGKLFTASSGIVSHTISEIGVVVSHVQNFVDEIDAPPSRPGTRNRSSFLISLGKLLCF
jgi:hypothetical protein